MPLRLQALLAGDGSAPIQPGVRVYDSLNIRDSGFRRAVAGGLTSLNIMSGSGHLMSGQTVYVKLRNGNTIEDLCYRGEKGEIPHIAEPCASDLTSHFECPLERDLDADEVDLR